MTVIFCFCLIGCDSGTDNKLNPTNFKERQKQLFYGIDHKKVYQSCQELMRLRREGKLSSNTFYYDDTVAKQNELTKPIRSLQPTCVSVGEVMIDVSFHHDKDGMQLLRCFSNEFGEPKPHNENSKGFGFRSEPFDMDKLSGTESLDYLNENYDHFQMELIPGLTYERYTAEQIGPPQDIRQSNEQMDMLKNFMMKTIEELAVKKQKLLHQTDHHELLKVCRQIIKDYNNGVFSKSQISIHDASAKDLKHIPEIILNLEPVYVWLSNNRVMVALIGGLDHAGVTAYMNNKEAVARDDDMKLIDGLRYYDDGLREADDDYKEYLESLRNEAIPYLDWKRKQMNLPIPQRMKDRK
jgi:hypothetical protein